jgi:hypothetical protein
MVRIDTNTNTLVSGGQSIGKWLLHNVIFKPASLVFWSRSKEPDQIVQEKTYVVMRNVKVCILCEFLILDSYGPTCQSRVHKQSFTFGSFRGTFRSRRTFQRHTNENCFYEQGRD